ALRGKAATRDVLPRLHALLPHVNPVVAGWLTIADGIPVLEWKFAAGIEGAEARALALLLSPTGGLASRLGQCKKPGCDKFRLDFEGRPHTYCNEAHRLAYDQSVAKE